MRYGIISDVHANRFALEAAVAKATRAGVDRFVCPGDIVGYGPHPNECIEILDQLGTLVVAGNHDLVVTGDLSHDSLNPLAVQTLRWTGDVLSEASRAYLTSLPALLELGEVVVAHGALDDPEVYVKRPEQALAQMDLAERRHRARLVLLGHTHRAWAVGRSSGEVAVWPTYPIPLTNEPAYLLNAGSVGQSREVRAVSRFGILDLERNVMDFHAIPYDHRRVRRDLKKAGLPEHACHVRPSLPGMFKQTRRKLLRN